MTVGLPFSEKNTDSSESRYRSMSNQNVTNNRAVESSSNAEHLSNDSERREQLTKLREAAKINTDSYADKVRGKLLPLISFDPSKVVGNPAVEVGVGLASDGTIIGRKILNSSGDVAWDRAVLRAIDDAQTLPKDNDGKVPKQIRLTFRPKD